MAKDYKILYKELENENKKLKQDVRELQETNTVLNILDTQKIKKIIVMQHLIHELRGGQVVRKGRFRKNTKNTN